MNTLQQDCLIVKKHYTLFIEEIEYNLFAFFQFQIKPFNSPPSHILMTMPQQYVSTPPSAKTFEAVKSIEN